MFGEVELNLHSAVMLIGRGGLLGSAPGLLVGMGLGKGHSLLLTLTHIEEGKLSSCSHDVSSKENLIKICILYSGLPCSFL